MNLIESRFFTRRTMISAIQNPIEKLRELIHTNLHFGHVFMVLHPGTRVQPGSLLVMSISISSTMELI